MADETEEQPAAPAGEAPPEPATARGRVLHVPLWAALVAAAVLLFGAGFGIGWAAAPGGGGDHGRFGIERPFPIAPGGGAPFGSPGGGVAGPRNGAFLGVTTAPAPSGQQGVQVNGVQSGSPADQAGLKAGDLITAVDGNAVNSPQELRQRIVAHQPGDHANVTYTRNGSSAQASVTLGTRGGSS